MVSTQYPGCDIISFLYPSHTPPDGQVIQSEAPDWSSSSLLILYRNRPGEHRHSEYFVAPVLFVRVPTGHSVHWKFPGSDLYEEASQGTHTEGESNRYDPAGHVSLSAYVYRKDRRANGLEEKTQAKRRSGHLAGPRGSTRNFSYKSVITGDQPCRKELIGKLKGLFSDARPKCFFCALGTTETEQKVRRFWRPFFLASSLSATNLTRHRKIHSRK